MIGAAPWEQRFWSRVERGPGCWEWTGARNAANYGNAGVPAKDGAPAATRAAHRVAYELLVGPIPAGLELDHLCRNTGCVNPAHLEPVTHKENVRRALPFRPEQTHCKRGHPLSGENMYLSSTGGRTCRICARASARRSYIRNRPPLRQEPRVPGHRFMGELCECGTQLGAGFEQRRVAHREHKREVAA